MSEKEEVLQHIANAKALVFDSNTFLRVRVERSFYRNHSENQLGGGNLLIALGLFSALGYLAKIYALLKGDLSLPDKTKIMKAKEKLKTIDKEIRDYFSIKRSDSINETAAFAKLLSDKDCPQHLGIDKSEYEKIYHDIRDHLSHRIAPNKGYIVIAFESDESHTQPYNNVKSEIMRSQKPVFEDKSKLYVDLLARDVEIIANWIMIKLQNDEFSDKNIHNTYTWLADLD